MRLSEWSVRWSSTCAMRCQLFPAVESRPFFLAAWLSLCCVECVCCVGSVLKERGAELQPLPSCKNTSAYLLFTCSHCAPSACCILKDLFHYRPHVTYVLGLLLTMLFLHHDLALALGATSHSRSALKNVSL